MDTTTFTDLDLNKTSLRALDAAGYSEPTEIQARSIPVLLRGEDILATAQTGTGKTAAFVVPMVERLARHADGRDNDQGHGSNRTRKGNHSGGGVAHARPRALVVTPTRELALQIEESVSTYGMGSRLRCASLYGGASRNKQISELRKHPHIVIATPGRLEDLMGEHQLTLEDVEYLVLDEADRMLDMGFIHAMRRIVHAIPDRRQTALFSATMPRQIEELAREFLKNPTRVAAEAGEVRVDRIRQSVMYVAQEQKLTLLSDLIKDRGMFRVLVFTRTKHRARKVAKILLRENIDTDAIHGDKGQGARNRALEAFKSGKIQVLVATDVASRGIDVDDITHVINFEIPNEPETYVHRIGRTARAGTDGEAISLVDASEMTYIRDIEKLMGVTIPVDERQPFHEKRATAQKKQSPPRPAPTGNNGSRNASRNSGRSRGRRRGSGNARRSG